MRTWTKTTAYLTVACGGGLFAWLFFRAHALVAHQPPAASKSLMFTYLALFALAALLLVWLSASDIRAFVRNRTEAWMVQAASSGGPAPELEEAQKLRASGEPLDAIRVLREHLQANPYNVTVMARIAEIYRYDLSNNLAAALEYEELLKHKVPDEQWAWAALHLAKLYGELNELEKSVSLLERLDDGYAHTVAGRRAKKALEHMRNPGAQASPDDDAEPGEVASGEA